MAYIDTLTDRVRTTYVKSGHVGCAYSPPIPMRGVVAFTLSQEIEHCRCHSFKHDNTPNLLRILLNIATEDGELDNLAELFEEFIEWRDEERREIRRMELVEKVKQDQKAFAKAMKGLA